MEHLSLPKLLRPLQTGAEGPSALPLLGSQRAAVIQQNASTAFSGSCSSGAVGCGGGIAIAKLPVQRYDTLAHRV